MNISKFDSTRFYREFTKRSSPWKGASGVWEIEFMHDGGAIELLESYYKPKYNYMVTTRPMSSADNETADVAEYVKEARSRAMGLAEHREVLLVKFSGPPCYENGHAIPLIYIKSGNKEALFLANSLGTRINSHEWIVKNPGIPVYIIEDLREMSNTGCYVDAFAFLKDAIGKEGESYRIPDLLAHLEAHSTTSLDKKYNKITKLHPRLLRTFQRPAIVTQYSDPLEQDVPVDKKGNTIAQHFEFYKQTAQESKELPSYLPHKGMKMRGVVEMEFYLQQLPEITSEQRARFIEGAKLLLKPKAAPTSESVSLLHEYACEFARNNNCKIKPYEYPVSSVDDKLLKDPDPVYPKSNNPFLTTLAFGVGGALLGALSACVFKPSPNICLLKALASCFSPSEAVSAVVTNATVGGFIGMASSYIYVRYIKGQDITSGIAQNHL